MKSLLVILIGVLFCVLCFADPAAPTPAPTVVPEWIEKGLAILASVPFIGPWVAKALAWLGTIASVLTALFTCFFAIVKSIIKVLNLLKLVEFASKIELFYQKVAPYLMFFSMYNAKLPEKKVEEVKK